MIFPLLGQERSRHSKNLNIAVGKADLEKTVFKFIFIDLIAK